jgi:outer membrane protein TolC
MVEAKRRNIQDYRDRLLPMVKKSYDYGESSVIEYLLNQQRLYSMQEELLNQKRDYYHTLFELYTITEIKDRQ